MVQDHFTKNMIHTINLPKNYNSKIIFGPQLFQDSFPLLIYNTDHEVVIRDIKNAGIKP